MDQDATWYTEVGLGLRDTVLDGDPASPRKGAQQPHTLSIVAKRSPISATAVILFGKTSRFTFYSAAHLLL